MCFYDYSKSAISVDDFSIQPLHMPAATTCAYLVHFAQVNGQASRQITCPSIPATTSLWHYPYPFHCLLMLSTPAVTSAFPDFSGDSFTSTPLHWGPFPMELILLLRNHMETIGKWNKHLLPDDVVAY